MGIFVVTGTNRGIGLEYVRQISADSSNVVFAVVRNVNGDLAALKEIESQSEGRVQILEGDISSESSLNTLASTFASILGQVKKVNVLINNAAILSARSEDSTSLTTESLLAHMTANVMGPAKVVQGLLPHLAQDAVIANITSGVGSLALLSDGTIDASITPYSISKTALNMLTVHQAQQLKGQAIVVCIDPGHVKTTMGGPNAVLEIPDSARGVLGVIAGLQPADTSKFFSYKGEEVPW
jgi:NAD(P)-dependent dehydrogenase (short-subunit alcohol dehydrogenase family)